MAQNRYPGATWDPAPVDGGPFADGYAPRGVIHTTEGWTYASARAAYRAHRGWPHFTASWEGQRFQAWQHLDIGRAARALKNPAGGVQTNRARAVQIELVGTADKRNEERWGDLYVANFPEEFLAGVAALMRWVEQTCGVRREAPGLAWIEHPEAFGQRNGLRMGAQGWRLFRGWCGHQHVPENEHGDPGRLDIARLLAPEKKDTVWRPKFPYKLGQHNHGVLRIQRALNRRGERLVEDGRFGPATEAATKRFQRKAGLAVDGIVGPLTWAKLRP